MNKVGIEEMLQICRVALEQLGKLIEAAESGQPVILNGTRMTATRAAGLIARWALEGVEACELMIVRE